MQDNFEKTIANQDVFGGFFVRLAAYLLDSLILAAIFFIPDLVFFFLRLASSDSFLFRDILFSFSLWDILKYLLCSLYFVLLTYFSGATLGKKAMRLKVITPDGSKLTFINVLYRETLGKYLSAIILYIGYILIGADKEKRGLHDILCDTRVIYTCKIVEYRRVQNVYMQQAPYMQQPPYMQPPTPPDKSAGPHTAQTEAPYFKEQ